MSCQGFSGIWCLAFFYVWEQQHIHSNRTHVCFAVLSTLLQSWPVKATGTLRLSAFHNRYVSFISDVSKSEQRYEHLSTIAILVNTPATERLYTLICDWCDVNKDSIVLGITNAEFICGKAEFFMDGLMKRYGRNPNLVAVVDPPRAGLHVSRSGCVPAHSQDLCPEPSCLRRLQPQAI
ncbi:uncharacterized protein LOC135820944 isoform X2 [Sycon ciliatum]|uniref:uncharacterized protein LOC135820944 isoform X2 n=1 Tax=Sycon ciliatum TaxID=27933 RepID=UPI0031F617F1